jgi:hypothetical protein
MNPKRLNDHIDERLIMLNQELEYHQTELINNAVKMGVVQFEHNLQRRFEIAGAIREMQHLKTRALDWK